MALTMRYSCSGVRVIDDSRARVDPGLQQPWEGLQQPWEGLHQPWEGLQHGSATHSRRAKQQRPRLTYLTTTTVPRVTTRADCASTNPITDIHYAYMLYLLSHP